MILRLTFLQAYEMRNAWAVIHSHGIEACLVTMIHPLSKEFRITHMEMIKGIEGHGYHDELVVPIIENTAYEMELTESFTKAIEAYPKTTVVLVRNHGVYIWGETWISAKTQTTEGGLRAVTKSPLWTSLGFTGMKTSGGLNNQRSCHEQGNSWLWLCYKAFTGVYSA